MIGEQVERFISIGSVENVKTSIFEQGHQTEPDVRFIFDDQDLPIPVSRRRPQNHREFPCHAVDDPYR
jgi:hypothetical protein